MNNIIKTATLRLPFRLSKKSIFLISKAISQSLTPNLCERSVAHCPNALWAFTFRHPCLPSPSEKGGSKAELLKISRKADRDAPCDQARMLDSVRTEVVSTDAYKWSNRVGARCTDHTRPQMHRRKTHKRTQTCIGASPKARML